MVLEASIARLASGITLSYADVPPLLDALGVERAVRSQTGTRRRPRPSISATDRVRRLPARRRAPGGAIRTTTVRVPTPREVHHQGHRSQELEILIVSR
jgi:hypothetical protein